jgi:hypothetical protein
MTPMKMILLAMLLLASPVGAQTQIAPKTELKGAITRGSDPCAPIGRTGKGELVYSMKCNNLPAPPPPARAEAREAPAAEPAPEPEVERGGIFGWSFDRRR